jgi:hypothetical protein
VRGLVWCRHNDSRLPDEGYKSETQATKAEPTQDERRDFMAHADIILSRPTAMIIGD